MPTLTFPTIHLNGSSPDRLVEGLRDACTILRAAQDALGDCSPNARDYYPQGPGAFNRADEEHRARRQRIADVKAELEAIWNHVADAKAARSAR